MTRVTTPKKPRKLPPRGKGGKFVKSGERVKVDEPEFAESPIYSPHRIGVGEPIDWQRELTREVMPPRRRGPERVAWAHRRDKLGWGVILGGVVGIAYAVSKLPGKGKHL